MSSVFPPGTFKTPARLRVKRAIIGLLVWMAVLAAVVWTLFPFYWAIITSLKGSEGFFENRWLPFVMFDPTLYAWHALIHIPKLGTAMWHSMVVTVAAASVATIISVPAGYAIARCPFPQRVRVGTMFAFMILRLMPPVALVTPYLLLTLQLGIRDTLLALILINSTLNAPVAIIIMSGVFLDVPGQLEEAAWVDGANRWKSFSRILLPLVSPAIVVSWILCFAFTWNEAMLASAMSFKHARTMPELIIATGGGGGVDFQAASSRSLLIMVFPLIASLYTQRYLVRGLSLGAVKG